jgi:hypothetical protein
VTAHPDVNHRPSIRAEVATAFRRIAAEYHRLPAEVRDSLDVDWKSAEVLLDRALLDGNRQAAIAAIRAFENAHFDVIERAARKDWHKKRRRPSVVV